MKFNEEEEERCPNLSLLLESSKLQWIVRSEKEEISPPEREKGKKNSKKRYQAPTVASSEGDSGERGGFEANS